MEWIGFSSLSDSYQECSVSEELLSVSSISEPSSWPPSDADTYLLVEIDVGSGSGVLFIVAGTCFFLIENGMWGPLMMLDIVLVILEVVLMGLAVILEAGVVGLGGGILGGNLKTLVRGSVDLGSVGAFLGVFIVLKIQAAASWWD